jgi:hypothetical protein
VNRQANPNARLVGMMMAAAYTPLSEYCSEVHMGENLSDPFHIQNGLKQGDALSPLLFNFALLTIYFILVSCLAHSSTLKMEAAYS